MNFNLSLSDFVSSGLAALVGGLFLGIIKHFIRSYSEQIDDRFVTVKAKLNESEHRDKKLDDKIDELKRNQIGQTTEIEKLKAIIESLRFQNDVLNEKIDALSDDMKEFHHEIRETRRESLGRVIVKE